MVQDVHTGEESQRPPGRAAEVGRWYFDPCRVPIRLLIAAAFMEFQELEHWLFNRITAVAIALAERDPVEMARQIRTRLSRLCC